MGEQGRVDPVLQRRAVLDQVQAEARPLPLGPYLRIGQPHLRDQVAAGELGQHPGVDPVGLARQRRQRLRPLRISDPHIPARSSSWSCTKRAPFIDSITANTARHRPVDAPAAQPVRVGRRRARGDQLPSAAAACQSRRLRLRSSPTYNMHRASSGRDRGRTQFSGRPSLITSA